MSRSPAPPMAGASPWALNIGLFLAVLCVVAGLVAREPVLSAFALALHMLLRIYDGRFSGWRKVTWLALVACSFLAMAATFLRLVFPPGQLSFWMATEPGTIGSWLASMIPYLVPSAAAAAMAAFVVDSVALHGARLRDWTWWRLALFFAAAVILAAISTAILHRVFSTPPNPAQPSLTPMDILPPLETLSTIAVLRATPSKVGRYGLAASLFLLPSLAAWARGWRFHAPRTRIAWLVLSAGLGTSWLGLWALGLLPPEGVQQPAIALIAYQFVFFAIVPILLGRLVHPREDRAA